jgi:hypothetical protein
MLDPTRAGLATTASLVVVAVAVAVAAATGCGGPRVSPAAPQATARLQLPEDFPVMPGAGSLPAGEGNLAGRWESSAPGPAVYRYYLEALPAAGYRELHAAPGGAVAIIRFTDRAERVWQLDLLAIRGPNDGTEIRLGRPRP